MWSFTNRGRAVGWWIGILAAVAIGGAWSGVSVTMGTAAFLVCACVVPPAVMLLVWQGAPKPTVAEILCAVDRRD
jgi:hypothetical protein